jgi:hypothetical protein
MTASKVLSALFLMGLIGQSLGFAALSTSFRKNHATNCHKTIDTSRTSLSAFTVPDDLDVDSPLLTTMRSLLLSISPTSSTLLDPKLEAEVLTDMSHVALDFTSFLNSSKALLKKSSVIGRVLVIFADYIPDHSIHPEELAIQLFMLGLAIKNLASPSIEN